MRKRAAGRRAGVVASFMLISTSWAGPAAEDGKQLYETNCAICHMVGGTGSPGLAPPLSGPVWKQLGDRAPAYMAGVMVSGLAGVPLDGIRYYAAMPPWLQLSDAELAAIGNYVLKELNGEQARMDMSVVKQARDASLSNDALKELRSGG